MTTKPNLSNSGPTPCPHCEEDMGHEQFCYTTAGQTVEKQAAPQCPQCDSTDRRELNDKCRAKLYQPIHLKQWHPWHDAQEPQPLSAQDETAEHETVESLIDFFSASGYEIDRTTCGNLLLRIEHVASSRLSAACQECNHPMRWHDNADGHWCVACVGRASETRLKLAEKEQERLRESLSSASAYIEKLREMIDRDFTPQSLLNELVTTCTAYEAALGEAQKGTK